MVVIPFLQHFSAHFLDPLNRHLYSATLKRRLLFPTHRFCGGTQKYYAEVTGKRLAITKDPEAVGHLIVIGSDSVNRFSRTAVEQKIIPPLNIGASTDDYCIRSAEKGGRRYLFLAGGNGRAMLYAVYDFFERQAECRYFWDGDIVSKAKTIEMSGLDVAESPRFTYRGTRYFAHRSLDRFQAEHWGPEQWEQEIDWLIKKRLNLFMLRIGMDDVYQRAFPEIVPYPPIDAPLPEAVARSYDDRTSAWLQGNADAAAAAVKAAGERCMTILTALRDTLALHDDYSMNASMAKLQAIQPVNPYFEQALKGNAENGYCRTYIYELFNDYYLPQMNLYMGWVNARMASGDTQSLMKPHHPLPMQAVVDGFYAKPLVEMTPPAERTRAMYQAVLGRLAEMW